MGIERDSLFPDSLHHSATVVSLISNDHVLENDQCVLGKWVVFMLTIGQEGFPLIEINSGSEIWEVAFTANGEYIVSGDDKGVRVWRVEDSTQIATLEVKNVVCLAVSQDGRWIAAGTHLGEVFVWDAKTYKKVFSYWGDGQNIINSVDFSPNSTQLNSASGYTATIWDIATRR